MNNIRKNSVRKFWMDGRTGHSTYLMFFLVFVNFLLITYNFLIDGNQVFEKYFSNLWFFMIVFVILYIPCSILIGRWHEKTQLSIDQDILRSEEPVFAKMFRVLLDVKTNKASEEEIREFRKMLEEIEKKDINEF